MAAERREFELSQEQLDKLLKASEPVPYVIIGGVEPPHPQQNANAAWQELAAEMGFQWETVEPVEGKDQKFISAIPIETENE